jgi:hypothetical protein
MSIQPIQPVKEYYDNSKAKDTAAKQDTQDALND